MSMQNSRKLLLVLLSVIGMFLLIGIIISIVRPDEWVWIVVSLFIGLLIAVGPLLRAYVKAKRQEEMYPSDDLSTPAKGVSCSHCGYEMHHKESYCNNCGQKVGK